MGLTLPQLCHYYLMLCVETSTKIKILVSLPDSIPYSPDSKHGQGSHDTKKVIPHNLAENHSNSAGGVTSRVNFALTITIFRCS
jgi:hypothetical protein